MDKNVFDQRIGRVLQQMEREKIDCFLIGPSSTLKYLTGYGVKPDERLLMLVLAVGQTPFFVANQLYALQLEQTPIADAYYWKDGEDAISTLIATLSERGVDTGAVAVDKSMPGMFLVPISQRLPQSRITLGNVFVDGLRVYKDESEMALMMQACKLGAQALGEVIARGRWWLGKTEAEFMGQLSFEMSRLGLQLPSGIVAVGANAAAPHHVNGQTVIQEGQCLLIDFGANYKNYNTDMTRTFHFGEPSDEFKKVYNIVLEALYRGHGAAKAGAQLQDVDRAARSYITQQGYGEYFIHRTGHGIGIDGHEGPPAGEGETTEIRTGMAFSIEPGIYLPGKFGVRIEDQALITKDGLRILHDFPRELQII